MLASQELSKLREPVEVQSVGPESMYQAMIVYCLGVVNWPGGMAEWAVDREESGRVQCRMHCY